MKRNPLTITVGAVLLVIFGLLLFVFQVRQSEVAVVTTFSKPTREITEANWYVKWPWPIQKVHLLDRRVQNLEGKFEEVLLPDGNNLLVQVYVGWTITEPKTFFPKFAGGSVTEAEKAIDSLVRSVKNEVVPKHPFAHFVSTDPKEIQFTQIEKEMLDKVRERVRANNYGLEVQFLGIKKLGLPESVTKTVFERMESERQVLVSKIQFEGEAQASNIRNDADSQSARLLADADAQATRIKSEGEREAARNFAVFKQNPDLAILLLQNSALDQFLKEKTTLILDEKTPGVNLLRLPPSTKK
jgi:modulator of FtsH protease HflC